MRRVSSFSNRYIVSLSSLSGLDLKASFGGRFYVTPKWAKVKKKFLFPCLSQQTPDTQSSPGNVVKNTPEDQIRPYLPRSRIVTAQQQRAHRDRIMGVSPRLRPLLYTVQLSIALSQCQYEKTPLNHRFTEIITRLLFWFGFSREGMV